NQSRELSHTSGQLQSTRKQAAEMWRVTGLASLHNEETIARLQLEAAGAETAVSMRADCLALAMKHERHMKLVNCRSVAVETETTDSSELRSIVDQSQRVIDAVHEQVFALSQQLETRTKTHHAEMRRRKQMHDLHLLQEHESTTRARIIAMAEASAGQVL